MQLFWILYIAVLPCSIRKPTKLIGLPKLDFWWSPDYGLSLVLICSEYILIKSPQEEVSSARFFIFSNFHYLNRKYIKFYHFQNSTIQLKTVNLKNIRCCKHEYNLRYMHLDCGERCKMYWFWKEQRIFLFCFWEITDNVFSSKYYTYFNLVIRHQFTLFI